jgi:hypothetical protein
MLVTKTSEKVLSKYLEKRILSWVRTFGDYLKMCLSKLRDFLNLVSSK